MLYAMLLAMLPPEKISPSSRPPGKTAGPVLGIPIDYPFAG
jgi:hypothetical protein